MRNSTASKSVHRAMLEKGRAFNCSIPIRWIIFDIQAFKEIMINGEDHVWFEDRVGVLDRQPTKGSTRSR
jgi:hypothetical protein